MRYSDAALSRFATIWQRMMQRGMQPVTADTLNDWVSQQGYAVVLLSTDPVTVPEVSDNVVIIPEVLAEFPHLQWQVASADLDNSELLADQYQIIKRPAVLVFARGHYLGAVCGVHGWGEIIHQFHALLQPAAQDIIQIGNIPHV